MLNSAIIQELALKCLKEDAPSGDLTTNVLFNNTQFSASNIDVVEFVLISKSKKDIVVCGLELINHIFSNYITNYKTHDAITEGSIISPNDLIMKCSGNIKNVLEIERTALNIIQHMCGVATQTRTIVNVLKSISPETELLNTRKTIPTMREIQKYATFIGGAKNHRNNLSDGILIKDNHITALGGVKNVLKKLQDERSKRLIPLLTKTEIECDTLDQLQTILEHGHDTIDVIMLDNFTPAQVRKAMAMVLKANTNYNGKNFLIEVSGGINLDNIADYAAAKPHFISLGMITHSVSSADISLDIV